MQAGHLGDIARMVELLEWCSMRSQGLDLTTVVHQNVPGEIAVEIGQPEASEDSAPGSRKAPFSQVSGWD